MRCPIYGEFFIARAQGKRINYAWFSLILEGYGTGRGKKPSVRDAQGRPEHEEDSRHEEGRGGRGYGEDSQLGPKAGCPRGVR